MVAQAVMVRIAAVKIKTTRGAAVKTGTTKVAIAKTRTIKAERIKLATTKTGDESVETAPKLMLMSSAFVFLIALTLSSLMAGTTPLPSLATRRS